MSTQRPDGTLRLGEREQASEEGFTCAPLCQPPNLHTGTGQVAACAPVILDCLAVVGLSGLTVAIGEGSDDGGCSDIFSLDQTSGRRSPCENSQKEGLGR
jgi:hypothetical protein